jgi:hypothetical protein
MELQRFSGREMVMGEEGRTNQRGDESRMKKEGVECKVKSSCSDIVGYIRISP